MDPGRSAAAGASGAGTENGRFPSRWNLAAVLAAGAVIFATCCQFRSLWFDEFHFLHHVRAPDLAGLFASVRTDNHPPLFLLLMWWSTRLLGESHFGLRLPSMLAGLSCLLLTSTICTRLPDRPARTFGAWMLLGSSYLLLISTEARVYSLLALAVLGLLWSILRVTEGRGSGFEVALWTIIGLHTHYYFLIYLAVAGLGVLVLRLSRLVRGRVVVPILLGMVAGSLAFLPWLSRGFVTQYRQKVRAGASAQGVGEWIQSIAHLLFIDTGRLGGVFLYGVALPGCLAALALGLMGIHRLWTAGAGHSEDQRRLRILLLLCLAMAVMAPVAAKLIGLVLPRLSYNWRYISGSCAPLVMLVAAGWREKGRTARVLGGVVLCTTFISTLLNSVSAGREDYRGAARYIFEHAMPGDVVLVTPTYYAAPEQAPTGWDYYAKELAADSGKTPPLEIRTTHWEEALSHSRVWVLARGKFRVVVFRQLRQAFGRGELTKISVAVNVHRFQRAPTTQTR